MEAFLSFDEKFLSNVFKKYQKVKVILQHEKNSLQEKRLNYGQDKLDVKQMLDYQNYLKTVETILALMPKAEYTCLIKEFLSEDDKLWWKKSYSQDTYQKLKHKAISRFLYLFLL